MSIKTRLLISYIAMTLIPVILFALIVVAVSSVYLNNVTGSDGSKSMPPFWETFNQHNQLIAGVKFMTEADPNKFNSSRFLKNTDERLNQLDTELVVKKNNQFTFISPFLKSKDLKKQLQRVQGKQSQNSWWQKVDGKYTVQTYQIKFSDNSIGMVYLLSDLTKPINSAKKLIPLFILSLLLVIGTTNGLLTFFVSRSLIKPLQTLKNAANLIKVGNLDNTVNLNRKDEIGELGDAFEEMRARLKESIFLQLQYEENRKELISNISHDLKTPITGIKVCVQGIQEGIADTTEKREKYINMIAKKAEDMDHLIDELLLYSKLDLKRMPFHLEQINLNAYLQDFVDEMLIDPRIKGIHINFSNTSHQPILVIADREKLRRVIMNILENSLKYMDKQKKEICVKLLDDKEHALVQIEDNGPGIESEALLRIFDRFYRAEKSRNTATGGTGLGLAIVKQIIEGQGGSVWAKSQVGKGTSIYFTLPKAECRGEQE